VIPENEVCELVPKGEIRYGAVAIVVTLPRLRTPRAQGRYRCLHSMLLDAIMTGEHGGGALRCSCGCRIRGLCEVHRTWKEYAGIVRTLPVDLFPPIGAAGVNARN
jgi:hypothetical protein